MGESSTGEEGGWGKMETERNNDIQGKGVDCRTRNITYLALFLLSGSINNSTALAASDAAQCMREGLAQAEVWATVGLAPD